MRFVTSLVLVLLARIAVAQEPIPVRPPQVPGGSGSGENDWKLIFVPIGIVAIFLAFKLLAVLLEKAADLSDRWEEWRGR